MLPYHIPVNKPRVRKRIHIYELKSFERARHYYLMSPLQMVSQISQQYCAADHLNLQVMH
jgi:hypothetical protein